MYLKQNKRCIICGKRMNNGIMINGLFICRNCELLMINANTDSKEYYYIETCIKSNLVPKILRGEKRNCKRHL